MAEKLKSGIVAMGENGTWAGIRVPFNVEQEYGSKARVSVKGTVKRADVRRT